MNFAGNLKTAMKERNITQTQLYELTGIGKSSISQYLSGKNKPKMPVMRKLADALDVSVDYLNQSDEAIPDVANELTNLAIQKVTIAEAARLLGTSKQFVRVALQSGIAPFGFAVKMSSNRYTYHISPKKLKEYIEISE